MAFSTTYIENSYEDSATSFHSSTFNEKDNVYSVEKNPEECFDFKSDSSHSEIHATDTNHHSTHHKQRIHRYKQKLMNSGIHPNKPHRHLVTYHDLPLWQKDNDYIIYGYVRETGNFFHCLDTIFFLNNETMNVLTHLLPGAVLPLLLFSFIPYFLTHSNFISYIPPCIIHLPEFSTTEKLDNLIFSIFFVGFMTCLSCSAIFHTLKVHSHRIASMGSKLDYAGILFLIASSLIGIIYYAFIDHTYLQKRFISLTSLIGMVSLIITWHPKFRTSEWRPIRTSTFIIFSFTGLIPICCAFYIFGKEAAIEKMGLKYVGYEGLAYLSGAALYAFRFPERLCPGRFDLIGHSHQIFHCLVVLGAYFHFKALVHAYIYAKLITLGGTMI